MNKCDNLCRILVILVVCAASIFTSCTSTVESEKTDVQTNSKATEKTESSGGPPPLIVEVDAPLLLDEPTEQQQASTRKATKAEVENGACFVCHVNYDTEPLASRHAKADIGCTTCHGKSFAHRNDENNTTPPEKMYLREEIDSYCQRCHNSHDISPIMIANSWVKRNPNKVAPDKFVCTDCHGDHQIKVRTVIWDKKTGKLLSTNRGE